MVNSPSGDPTVICALEYPVKSCSPIVYGPDDRVVVTPHGLGHDRHAALIGADGSKRTQRDRGFEVLARVRPSFRDNALVLDAPDMPRIVVPYSAHDGPLVTVDIWGDLCEAMVQEWGEVTKEGVLCPARVSDWLTEYLRKAAQVEETCRLVRQRGARLLGNRENTPPTTPASLADGAHVLLVSSASHDAFNAELKEAGEPEVPMSRWRPNLIVEGLEPWAEKDIGRVRLGSAVLKGVRDCTRCSIVNVTQETGVRRKGDQTLKTVAQKHGNVFGRYMLVEEPGSFMVGDRMESLED